MGTLSDLVNKVNTAESSILEFKSAKHKFPRSFWETYSSFANTQGGIIYLGVKEEDHKYIIDGLTIEQIKSYEKELWDNLNNPSKVSVNILTESDVQEIETEDGYVLEISIPRAQLSQRPVYLKGNVNGNTYKRNDEGDYVCTIDEVKRMYAEANLQEVPQDSRILEHFSFEEDIDHSSLQEYRTLFSTMHPTHPWASLKDIEFLTKLGGYRKDRRTKQEGLTLAGMLMFGKFSSITDIDCCPSYFPDYRDYTGSSESDRWSDRVYCDGSWEANLFQFYRRVYNKLTASLPKPFTLKNGRRIEDSPMHVALREAFVNSLIHCDFTVSSNIIVESYRNKYVFTNPGTLLIPLSQYYKGGESKCRNMALQQMFMQIGNAEKAGSGVDKILKGWKSANYRYPSIEEKTDKVILTLPLDSILSEDVQLILKKYYGEDIMSIDNEKLLVLAACASEGFTSNYRMQLVLEKHPSDITLLLKRLCQEGYLNSTGIGKGTTYHLNDSFLSKVQPNALIDSQFNVSISTDSSCYNEVVVGSKFSNVESSTPNVESFSGNMESSIISVKAKRGKMNLEQLQSQIIAVCRDEFKSLEDIAKGVGKKIKYLNNGLISRMVSEGILDRKYPDIPTHPGQQYKAHPIEEDNGEPTLF